jgi:hypothetical protein
MTITLAQRILAAGAICFTALIALVVIEGRARAAGTEVIVAMQPVDPRALLTGHYVILSFSETIPSDGACPPQSIPQFEQGWIALSRNGDRHSVSGVAATRQEAQALGEVLVRGSVICSEPVPGADGAAGSVRMQLAVERFHADQDEAVAIEKTLRDTRPGAEAKVFAILSIGADGTPRTKGLIVEGKRVELTWF